MVFSFFYEICLLFIALFSIPKFLYNLLFRNKYRESILKRFGTGFPPINKGNRKLIWVHAVSLGETKAVAALVKMLKAELDHPLILFSTTTETGYVEACRSISADYHVYMPFDFLWVIHSIMHRIAPDMVILCESDFWYNFLSQAKSLGAKVILVNGKISMKSMERFQKFPLFAEKIFSNIDLLCVQSQTYRKRFESLQINPDKIVVTGNIKFDGDYAPLPKEQLEKWRIELGIDPADQVLVIGSTHNPEENNFLKAMAMVWEKHPTLKVVLAPRHPERFNEVAGILQKNQINFRRLSQKQPEGFPVRVVLIDAMGLLRKCYQLADVAIVAGSYTTKVGGHNILEPSWYGIPVVFGPYMQNQPDLVELVKEYNAGLQVPMDMLPDVIDDLFVDAKKRNALGQGGLKLVSDVHGATRKTVDHIKDYCGGRL